MSVTGRHTTHSQPHTARRRAERAFVEGTIRRMLRDFWHWQFTPEAVDYIVLGADQVVEGYLSRPGRFPACVDRSQMIAPCMECLWPILPGSTIWAPDHATATGLLCDLCGPLVDGAKVVPSIQQARQLVADALGISVRHVGGTHAAR